MTNERVFYIAVALSALVALSPLLAVLVAMYAETGAPVLFRQPCLGLRGRWFQVLKFCTMTQARDAAVRLLPDAERLLPFGRWPRFTSLGIARIVERAAGRHEPGRTPAAAGRIPGALFAEQARRHEVWPGLTGWAQVNGRNATTWEERLRLDVGYVDHRSLWPDLRIIAMTVVQVLRREGIHALGSATMPESGPTARAKPRTFAVFPSARVPPRPHPLTAGPGPSAGRYWKRCLRRLVKTPDLRRGRAADSLGLVDLRPTSRSPF